jgi:PilZ domain
LKAIGENVGPQQTRESERRRSDRFAIERELRFRALNKRGGEEAGEGKTVNMSSSGVLFTSGQILRPGRRVELAISWPAKLNSQCALKLVARGRIVRFENGLAAMEIQQYEFRTQSAPGAATASGLSKMASV